MNVVESYRDYVPPGWIRPAVERLLGSLAPEHIGGLGAVILTNAASLRDARTGRVRGRKYRRRECLGFYHRATRDGRAWIELIVDNIVPRWSLPLNPIRDAVVGFTLYHEIGHHLHETVGSAKRGGEASADDWAMRLLALHARRRYNFWIRVCGVVVLMIAPLIKDVAKRRLNPAAPAGSQWT